MNTLHAFGRPGRRAVLTASLLAASVSLLLLLAGSALGAEAPRWQIVTTTNPTNLLVGEAVEPQLVLTATNVGGAATDGSPITITDQLPVGLTATAITGYSAYQAGSAENGEAFGEAVMACTTGPSLACVYSGRADPGDALIVTIHLEAISSPLAGAPNTASVEGGGAPSASAMSDLATAAGAAPFGPSPGSVAAAGASTQAGAHADFTTGFTLNTSAQNELAADPRDFNFALPPGLVGSTVGMARCPTSFVIELLRNPTGCPADTMVGMAILTLSEGNARGVHQMIVAPIFNVAPAPGEPAAFALNAFFFPVRLDTSVLASGGYGVQVSSGGVSQTAQTLSAQTTFWGVPADHSGPGEDRSLYNLLGGGSFGGPNPSQTRQALLTNPEQCSSPLSLRMSTDSWLSPGAFVSSEPASIGAMSGCERLAFAPSFSLHAENLQAAAPAGYEIGLEVPQNEEPDGLATPDLHDLRLTLPAGTVLNPAAASGLLACTDSQFDLAGDAPGSCPAASEVGTVSVRTPALPLPLEGRLFVGRPDCAPCSAADAAGGRLLRVFLQLQGEGEQRIVVKLEGRGRVDQADGRLSFEFPETPQLPFSRLTSTIKGGGNAVLVNPRSCGTVGAEAEATPWSTPSTPSVRSASALAIGEGCFGPRLVPGFTAGVDNPHAGASSDFVMNLSRSDQDASFEKVTVHLPEGLLAKIAGVTPCAIAAEQSGACGEGSLIGSVRAGLGAGPNPYQVSGGRVYLGEGYGGAPFALVFVVPATAGPFSLAGTNGSGDVVVRAKLEVDPLTTAVSAVSEALPQSLDGIPLQVRSLHVSIDRPGFIRNPTDCARASISAQLEGAEGTSVALTSSFQAADCAALEFKPKLALKLKGGTRRHTFPALKATLTYPKQGAYANIKKAQVTLPHSEFLEQGHIGTVCTRVQFAAKACPQASIYGKAMAISPLLDKPVSGPVYLRSSSNPLPDLVAELNGQIDVTLAGKIDTGKGGGIRNTFQAVPDAPVSKFTLELKGGKKGLLVNSEDICSKSQHATADFIGQNGKTYDTEPVVQNSCGAKKAGKRGRTHR